MSKNISLSLQEKMVFRKFFKKTKKIIQDKLFHSKKVSQNPNFIYKRNMLKTQFLNSDYFSCKLEKLKFFKKNPFSYIKNEIYKENLNDLKKGIYYPDMDIDLHGYNCYQAKKELEKLIIVCKREKFFCVNIIHGHGKNILKNQIPFWLIQIPDVLAFHRSPKRFGYNAAILVLIETN